MGKTLLKPGWFFSKMLCKGPSLDVFIFILFGLFWTGSSQCFFTGSCYTLYDRGRTYRGQHSTSLSGKTCVTWDRHLHSVRPSQYPQEHLIVNYCRNPLGRAERPWCYISPLKKANETYWEYCDIPKCALCLFRGVNLKEGDMFHDGCSRCTCTGVGIQCQECGEAPVIDQVGCYFKQNFTAVYPQCCPRKVCHGKDGEFVFAEYMQYLKAVFSIQEHMS